ncbi:MAG: T9SS type A sorting domain-containing protein [Bacteroidota bacterium]
MKSKYYLSVALLLLLFISKSEAQFVTLPDTNFINWLKTHGYSSCFNGNQMDTTCNSIVNATSLNCDYSNIYNLTGIRYFDHLTTLSCTGNQITTLGPALPATLLDLRCGNNPLTSLPPLTSNLNYLDCVLCQISTLPTLPATLKNLVFDINPIIVMPSLPSGLQVLGCSNTNRTTLPTLPSGLISLRCGINSLTSLPTLPSTLQVLYCNNNLLTSLPSLPGNMTTLFCNDNHLTSLPALSNPMNALWCYNNQLTSLPTLNNFIVELLCNNNLLTSLPAITAKLTTLDCSFNQLTTLPAMPAKVRSLKCNNNQLNSIISLPDTLNILYINNNVNLNCLPTTKKIADFKWASTAINCLPNAITITSATPSVAGLPLCTSWQPLITGPTSSCTSATLTAPAGGTYQWYLNGNTIAGATASTYSANVSGTYTCFVSSPCGSNLSAPFGFTLTGAPNATITPGGPLGICPGGSVTLSANTGTGYTYKWYLNGNVIAGATASIYNANSTGSYTCQITSSCGSNTSAPVVINSSSIPAATITNGGTITICQGTNVTLTANSGTGFTYQWRFNGIPISGATAINYSAATSAQYSVTVTNAAGCSATSSATTVTVNQIETLILHGNGSGGVGCVNGGLRMYAKHKAGNTYQWKKDGIVINGAVDSAYTTTTEGVYQCYISNGGCTVAGNPITALSQSISSFTSTGPTTFCKSSHTMTVQMNNGYFNNAYQWQNNGVNIPGANASSYAATTTGQYRCKITTAACPISPNFYTSIDYVTAGVLPQIKLTGDNGSEPNFDICSPFLTTWRSFQVRDISTDQLVADSGSFDLIRDYSPYYQHSNVPYITVDYYAGGSAGYYIYMSTACGTTFTQQDLQLRLLDTSNPPYIYSTDNLVCSSTVLKVFPYQYNSGPLPTNPVQYDNYKWKRNGVLINGAISPTYNATQSGFYTCIISTSCDTLETTGKNIVINNQVSVMGKKTFCRPSITNIYSVPTLFATNYSWSVPAGATITSGQNTSSITVSFAANAVAGNICVTLTNSCGTSSSCFPVTIQNSIPSTPGTITGLNNGCTGESKIYKIKKANNADTYLWTPPIGATINGSSSAFATVDTFVTVTFTAAFAGDTLRVRGVNCKGNSSERKLRINHNAPSTPGAISGLNVGLCNQSNVSYSINAVTNATGYTWRSNIAGVKFNGYASSYTTTSTSVSVSYTTFTTGQIYIKANNGCGSSAERSLTVNAKPAVPTIINGPVSVCDGQQGVAYSSSAVTNASAYNWTIPSGATVASGQNTTNITINFGATPSTGNVRVRAQNVCASSAYLTKSVTINNCPRVGDDGIIEIKIQPNPFNSSTMIVLPDGIDASQCELNVYDLFGRLVRSIKNHGSNIVEFERENLSSGIYNLQVIYNKKHSVTKLIIN